MSRACALAWVVSTALLLMLGCDSESAEPTPAESDAGAPADMSPSPADEGPPRDATVDPTGWVQIGTGVRRFESLEPGQEVPIIAGIQGGFHVWGGFRGGDFDDTEVRIRFTLELQGTVLARADYYEFSLPRDDDVFDYAAVSVVYDSNDDVEPTAGRTMTLTVIVEAADGQVLTDSIDIVPVCCE